MRGPLPKLGYAPLILGALLALAAVAWSARPVSHPRVATRVRIASKAASATQPVAAAPTTAQVSTSGRAAATSSKAEPGQAGMRAYIDPETGTFGPPTAEQAALAGQDIIVDSGEGLVEERMPNGAVKIDLQGQFQDYVVVRLDASGHRIVSCVKNPKLTLPNGPAPAVAPVER